MKGTAGFIKFQKCVFKPRERNIIEMKGNIFYKISKSIKIRKTDHTTLGEIPQHLTSQLAFIDKESFLVKPLKAYF
jgi:hypothetical protein